MMGAFGFNMRILLLICILLISGRVEAATSFVQPGAALDFGANAVTFTWPAATSANSLIACAVWWKDDTSTIDTVTDSAEGDLVDSGLGVQRLNSAHSMQMFYMQNIVGGVASSVTATFAASATPSVSAVSCHEIAGRATASSLDKTAWNTQNFTGTGTDYITSGNVTTTTNGQYLFCATHEEFGDATSAGTGFTGDTLGAQQVITEHLTNDQPSAGSIACLFTPSGTGGYITGLMSFKAATGPVTPPTEYFYRKKSQ